MITKLPNICIVSHDAGGAELISSYVKRKIDNIYLYVLSGPAVKIFERKLGFLKVSELELAIKRSELIICGTSWESNIDMKAITLSKKYGKKVISFLDHWVNYQGRFFYKKKKIFPDEIWVMDEYAKTIANQQLKSVTIKKKKNYYFQDLKIELNKTKKILKKKYKSILFLSEPITKKDFVISDGNKYFFDYDIKDAFNYFIDNIHLISNQVDNILIRVHPSETSNKWRWAEKNKLVRQLDRKESLIKHIVNSDVIVGCETMAMVVGLLAKKRVVSVIPPGGKKCSLPHKEIEHLQNLRKKNEQI